MKWKTRIEIEREILADVKKEMQKPRLTESVRNGLSAQAAARAAKKCYPNAVPLNSLDAAPSWEVSDRPRFNALRLT